MYTARKKSPPPIAFAKMNLALRGISHHLGGEADSSFTHDLHKGLYFNYIMANPPFNLKGWYDENLKTTPAGQTMPHRRRAMPTTLGFCICFRI